MSCHFCVCACVVGISPPTSQDLPSPAHCLPSLVRLLGNNGGGGGIVTVQPERAKHVSKSVDWVVLLRQKASQR
jgi:hypothetical protein